MPELKEIPKERKRGVKAKQKREFVISDHERKILKRVGRKIREDATKRGLKLDKLAVDINLARSALHEILVGRSNPKLLTLNAIAEELGYKNVMTFMATMAD